MPYVNQERRGELDLVVISMARADICANGDLNYVLHKFALRHVPLNYNSIKNYIGELEETIAEIRRKILAPYEEIKEKENGKIT